MKSAMGDALKAMKGPPSASPMMDESAGEGFASGGEKIDLSKIDPALIQAIIKELTESGMVEAKESPMEQAGEASVGLNVHDKDQEDGSEAAPSRDAIAAIADGGAGHEAGSLRSRAAVKAKGDLAAMKDKKAK